MKSTHLLASGATALTLSLFISPASAPLQGLAMLLFLSGEFRARWESKYLHPILERRYASWEKSLDYEAAALQGHSQKRLDWKYRRRGVAVDMRNSSRERYVQLCSQGRVTPPPSTIDTTAREVQALPQSNQPVMPTPAPTTATVPGPASQSAPSGVHTPLASAPVATAADLPLLKIESLRYTSFLMIWGTPGGGKSTLARMIARDRMENGNHEILIADPHGDSSEWFNWPLVGRGRNYESINQLMIEFEETIDQLYARYAKGERNFPWRSIVWDEFTQSVDYCPRAALFVKSCCSDIRKVNQGVVVVTHADTLAGLGGSTGMRAAIDRAAVKIQLETEIDLDSGEYRPLGTGLLQYPGMKPTRVRIPRMEVV